MDMRPRSRARRAARGDRATGDDRGAAGEAVRRRGRRHGRRRDGGTAAHGRWAGEDRDGLERLCRSTARPAVASGRVSRLPDGNVADRVKSPRSAGATHRVMTPMEFMARLSALVPPPWTPLVRYHGVVAPHSRRRVAVVRLPPRVDVASQRGSGVYEASLPCAIPAHQSSAAMRAPRAPSSVHA